MLTSRLNFPLRAAALSLVALGSIGAPSAFAADPAPVLTANFDDGAIPAGWTPGPGSGAWTVEQGRLVGRSATTAQISTIAFGQHLEDFRFEATVRFASVVNASRWLALGLDMPSNGANPWQQAALRSASTATNGIEFAHRTAANGWSVTDTASAPADAGTGKDVRVAIEVRGTSATWFFDGTQVLATNNLIRTDDGGFGLVVNGSTVQFDDIAITKLAPQSYVLPNDATALPKVIAHRGYSSVAPENTDVAMAIAAKTGADFVESDVATTADGTPWMLHDATVDRTTDGTGALKDRTDVYLRGLDAGSWFDPAFTGEALPSLDSQLAQVKRGSSKFLLEIKSPQTRAQVERIVQRVKAAGMTRKTVIQSFDDNIVRWSRELEPAIPTMILRGALDADPVATAKSLGVVSYNPSWAAIKGKPQLVDALNDAGIAVMPYTVDNPADWAAMRDQGIDGIITNKPGELAGWKARFAQVAPPKPAEPAKARILAPADGTRLTRGDERSVALDLQDETGMTVELDGKPVEQGATIAADDLALGSHTLRVRATGEAGEPAVAESTFTVAATAEGIASTLATADGIPTAVRTLLLPVAVEERWSLFTTLLRTAERRIPADVYARLKADAAALAAR